MKKRESCFLFAPAGQFDVNTLNEAGLRLSTYFNKVDYHPIDAWGYYSGTSDDRIQQFIKTLEKSSEMKSVPWLMAVRGGYGSIDLAPFFAGYRFTRKTILSGFSDLSILLNMHQDDDLFLPVYGLNAISSFSPKITEISEKHIRKILMEYDQFQYSDEVFKGMSVISTGESRGEICGGCLSVLITTIGTPFFPNYKNKILFLEDVAEPVYRLDRMLKQMDMLGVFDQLAGVILGEFTDCQTQFEVTPKDVFMKYFNGRNYPVVWGFPMGHGNSQVPLKFKQESILKVTDKQINIRYR